MQTPRRPPDFGPRPRFFFLKIWLKFVFFLLGGGGGALWPKSYSSSFSIAVFSIPALTSSRIDLFICAGIGFFLEFGLESCFVRLFHRQTPEASIPSPKP